ncbi:hypothetical protein JCM17845_11910 [Iodidimonas gelatinilytica]|uniref:EF-hand domain-containing protein n=1 Tax=Iodidimonas gelatinilytica TaxID=1236966 RepID=A0A5A7MXG5_9PROT|nr:EF-hand domain-containing protein [Iodidimonas gelatinilytica]GER00568.1 hypothetical protein JCM17845_11910 [Iodidimonas gelatinilytica]
MNKTYKGLILGGIGLVFASGVSLAAHHGDKGHGMKKDMAATMLKKLDADKNGSVEWAEIEAFHKKRFEASDKDGNGSLTLEEMKAGHKAMREQQRKDRQDRMFDKLDADGDGVLSREEMRAFQKRGDMDRDHKNMRKRHKDDDGRDKR